MTVTARLLGGVRVFDGERWHLPPSRKPIALLGYLACQEGWVERERLAFLFWPDVSRERARTNLRSLLTRSRSLPFAAGLECEATRVRWRAGSDVRTFRRAVEGGAWAEAVTTYGGPLLADAEPAGSTELESWLELERESLKEAYRSAVLQHQRELRAAGRFREAAKTLQALLAHDPLDEEAVQCLMSLHAERGEPALAAGLHRSFARRLSATLGLEPSSATERLAQEIESGASMAAAPGAARPPADGRPRALAAPGQDLPVPLSSFVGRDREMAELAGLLAKPSCRLLTVTGTAGVGKTRLALETARAVAKRYRDGTGFVPLDAVTSVHGLAAAIAGALGIRLHGHEDPLAQVAELTQDRSLLLVLDNFEHLIEDAEAASGLLRLCPDLRLLVTSRERLGLAEEWLFPLEGLAYAASGAQPEEARECEAVRFFVERARQVEPGFEASGEVVGEVLRVCRLVDGLPLGLELAAAWVRAMPVSDIADEIEGNLGFLQRARSSNARHRSVRAAFEHSWRLLTPGEQAALRKLTVFRGGFRREAAAFVAGASIAVLAALVDRSLLRVSREGRYDWHPLLHQYAREELGRHPEEQAEAERRHADYFVRLVEEANPHRGTPRDAPWRLRLEAELENLAAALDWAVRSANAEAGLQLATSINWLPWLIGSVSEQRAQLGRLLAMPSSGRSSARVTALLIAGTLAHHEADYEAARALYETCLAAPAAARSAPVTAKALANLAHLERLRGDLAAARSHLQRSLALLADATDETGVANVLNNLATIARLEGDFAAAQDLHEQALALGRKLRLGRPICQSLNGLGYLAAERGDDALARSLLEESLALSRPSGLYASVIASLNALGRLACAQGDHEQARALLAESLGIQRERGLLRFTDATLLAAAALQASAGRPDRAARLWGAAAALRQAEGSVLPTKQQAQHARDVAAARARLGDGRFEEAWAEGCAMDLAGAVAYAQDVVSGDG